MNNFLKILGVILIIFIAYVLWNVPEKLDGGKHLEYYTITSGGTYTLYLKPDVKIPQIVNLEHIFHYNPNSTNEDFFNKIYNWNSEFIGSSERGIVTEYYMDDYKVFVSSGLDPDSNSFMFVFFEPSNLSLDQFINFSLLERIDFPDKNFTIIIDEDSGSTYMNITVENKFIDTISYF